MSRFASSMSQSTVAESVDARSSALEFLPSQGSDLPRVKGYNIVNGQLREASSGQRFESSNPVNLSDGLGTFPSSSREDVHEALRVARDWHGVLG